MPRARFFKRTSDFCTNAGGPSELTTHASGLYAGRRRTLPTTIDVGIYTDTERLDIDGWFSNTAHAQASVAIMYLATHFFPSCALRQTLDRKTLSALQEWGGQHKRDKANPS